MLNRRRIKYIEMNPIVKNYSLDSEYNVNETIKDTKFFFKNRKDE